MKLFYLLLTLAFMVQSCSGGGSPEGQLSDIILRDSIQNAENIGVDDTVNGDSFEVFLESFKSILIKYDSAQIISNVILPLKVKGSLDEYSLNIVSDTLSLKQFFVSYLKEQAINSCSGKYETKLTSLKGCREKTLIYNDSLRRNGDFVFLGTNGNWKLVEIYSDIFISE